MKPGVSDLLLHIQNEILEAVASGDPLRDIADLLCRRIENLVPTIVCSVLTVDPDQKLHPLAGPSLPDAYSEALDGIEAGPTVSFMSDKCQWSAIRMEVLIHKLAHVSNLIVFSRHHALQIRSVVASARCG